jgi:glycosyltransferase involved in cell wall biosynthesis
MSHKSFFFKILDILDREKIPYFLFCGTLLGAVRENNFLPSDFKDTDIAVDDSYYWKIRQILDKEILKEAFKYSFIWRKEISISNRNDDYKVDIFFMEKINEDYAIYSYKPNPVNKRWDYEWKALFYYDLFYPLKTINFLGRKVSVPNQYKTILRDHYGFNWETPDPTYKTGSTQRIDDNYVGFYPAGILGNEYKTDIENYDIGFICVNLLRKKETKACIDSLQKFYKNIKIYVADQDEPSGEMLEFYEKHNVEYYYVPYDIGISKTRNFLIEKVKEPYLLWGDNDFLFSNNSNINHGIEILQSNESIGFVGGAVSKNNVIQHYERLIQLDKINNILTYIPLEYTNPEKHEIDGIEYYYCDLTFNYVLARTNIFLNQQLRWNPLLKCAYEHTDMFLRIKEYSNQRVVYCPSMNVEHKHLESSQIYDSLRNRKDSASIFAKSWNLKMNFTIGKGREIYAERVDSMDVLKNIKLSEINDVKFLKSLDKPALSIVMCTYNTEKYLKESIDSILKQSYENFELIIVNDGSTDNTHEVLKRYSCNKRIKIYNNSHVGLSKSRNFGINKSSGEYICFHDADDIMLEKRLEHSINYVNIYKEIDVFYGSYIIVDAQLDIKKRVDAIKYSLMQQYKQKYSIFSAGTSVVKKDIFLNMGFFDSNYEYVCDLDWAERMFNKGVKFMPIEEYFIYYRRHSNAMGIKDRELQQQQEAEVFKRVNILLSVYKNELIDLLKPIWSRRSDLQRAFPYFPNDLNYKFRGSMTILEWSEIHGIKEEETIKEYFRLRS